MKIIRIILLVLVTAGLIEACDCDGTKLDPCNCVPVVEIIRPGSAVLTEFHDTNPQEDGTQYPVAVRTVCVPGGTELTFTNDLSPGETVIGTVVADEGDPQSGSVDFGDQTFVAGTNQICIRGEADVNLMTDGTADCSEFPRSVEDCREVTVELDVPACRFDRPSDGDQLSAEDDDDQATPGFQHNVRVTCKGVNDGQVVQLTVNDQAPLEVDLSSGEAYWDEVDFAEGTNILEVWTNGTPPVETQIRITVDTGSCAVRLLPVDGTVFQSSNDEDPASEGLQITLTVETDPVGTFACADGSIVTIHTTDEMLSANLSGGTASAVATLRDGVILAYAEIQESGAGGRTGTSLTNHYSVCATPIYIDIGSPSDGLTITDAADRDPDEAGIQIAVTGTTRGIPTASDLRMLIDGEVVMNGTEPLRPTTFFPGADFSFAKSNNQGGYASFQLNKVYTVQVVGNDACQEAGASLAHVVTVQTTQRTCQIVDPVADQVLLAADDNDLTESNDLQYDVQVATENVPDGATFTLFGGESPLTGLVINGNQNVTEVTFTDGEKTLQCVLDTGEASPAVTINVDGHSPTIAITSPADEDSFELTDLAVELLTTGVEDGQTADVLVESATESSNFACTVTGNTAICQVALYSEPNIATTNTLTASISDLAGNPAATHSIDVHVLVATNPPVVTFSTPDQSQSQPITVGEADRLYDVTVQVQNIAEGRPVELVVVDNGHDRDPLIARLTTGVATFPNVLLPRGDVELIATAENAIGTGSSTVDLTVGTPGLPIVIVIDPADGTYTQQGTFDVTIDSDLGASETCYLCFRQTPPVSSLPPDCTSATAIDMGATDANGDTTIAGVSFGEGDYQLWATCTTGTSLPNHVVVDQTDPIVTFIEPTNPTTYNAASPDRSGQPGFQIRIQLTADVEDGQGAALTLDGATLEIIDDPLPMFVNDQITFAAVTVQDQLTQTLLAEVCDRAGNCGTSTAVSILVDRIAPDVTITDPENLDEMGGSLDTSLANGYQYDVITQFTNASVGDQVCLERNVASAGWEQIACYDLASGETDSYTFVDATILPDPVVETNVQLRATITDSALNSDQHELTVHINPTAPEVTITRPDPDQDMNIYWDMCDPDFRTQVDIQTFYTELGDILALCVEPSNGNAVGHCGGLTGDYGEAWLGTVTGVSTAIGCVELLQGDNTLVGYSENLPGQGNYSSPVTVHVDSVPPTVDTFTLDSDLDQNGCLSQAELGGFAATVTILEDGSGVEDQTIQLVYDWPPGTNLDSATITSNSATFFVSLSDGLYSLTAVFSDVLGNPNIREANPVILDPEAQRVVAVDTVLPVINISSPTEPTLNFDDDLISATEDLDFQFCISTDAEDGQLVAFEIDDAPAGSSAVAGGQACVDTSMNQGNHVLNAAVEDQCGNSATLGDLPVFVDTIKPTISCTQPANNSTFTEQLVAFDCTTVGSDVTQNITVSSAIGGTRCTPSVAPSGVSTFDCNLLEGTQDLTVTVTDPAGNVSDPDMITNVTVDITGCDIAFVGLQAVEVFNAADDKDGNPDNGLQIDLIAHSNSCTGTICTLCAVTLKKNGTPVGPAQPLDSSGDVAFVDVFFADGEDGTSIEVEIDDGVGNLASDLISVLVDLYPPTLERLAPGANDVDCVAGTDNPNVDGSAVLADKLPGAPCDMDFQFRITNGGDATYQGSLSVQELGSPLPNAGPASITQADQTITFTNVQIAHGSTHDLDVVVQDYAGNETHLAMTVEADVIAPATITDNTGTLTHSRHADVTLDWTAVGDDDTTGTATAYAIRWSRNPITNDTEWTNATEITNALTPAAAGSPETFDALWLPPLNTYHIALRALDEVGNHGPIPPDTTMINLWSSVAHAGPGGYFGYNMWNVGDINNDDHDDLAVSAFVLNGNEGTVFIFYGEDDLSNWSNGATPQQLSRGVAGELLGYDVCGVGDLDGDTISDLVLTGRGYDSSRGRVSIYFGRNGGLLPSSPDVEIRPLPSTATAFGRSAEIIGDINHNGYDDLFVGAPLADGHGRGYVFFGRSRADWIAAASVIDNPPLDQPYIPVASAELNILGVDTDDWFSFRHGSTTLGDVDSDNYEDFALPSSKVNEFYTFDGAAISAITGRDIDPATDSVDVITYGAPYDDGGTLSGFGIRAQGGFDFTGDSVADLVVSSAQTNRVYLFAGIDNSPGDPAVKIDPVFTKEIVWSENIWFGYDLEVGDINLDGLPDLLVGQNSSGGHRGFLFLNTGNSPYLEDIPDSTLTGTDYFGISVAIGDFDNNGLLDIAFGSLADQISVYY